jgi:hypothetical protein
MKLVTKNHKPLTDFTALVQQRTQKRPVLIMKRTYQWALHGLVIQVVLSHCAPSVANAAMAPAQLNWLSKAGDSTQQDFPTD